jgi:hypothetical protein
MPAMMRRFLRILLNVATALSLVLCAATCALWVRAQWVWHEVVWIGEVGRGGGATLTMRRVDFDALPRGPSVRVASAVWNVAHPAAAAEFQRAQARAGLRRATAAAPGGRQVDASGGPSGWGFRWDRHATNFGNGGAVAGFRVTEVAAPWWFLALLWAAAPARAIIRWRRRPPPVGLCPACGYDLRATPDRCPECGRTSAL